MTKGKALVVDDELSNRLILSTLLEKLDYQVCEAGDGAEALAVYSRERPDLVFMDVMLPGMDGYEATTRIKQLAGDIFVPIIFLTALTDQEALVHCIEAGGDDFLTKPYNHAILGAKIQALGRIRGLHCKINGLYARMRREEELAEQLFRTAVLAGNVAMDRIPHRLQGAGIFSGDLLLSARAPAGDLHLLLGDFTGHGLSAALGAMPTAEVFRTMTAKGFSPEQILAAIERKLHNLLPTGMYLAGVFVRLPPSLDHVQVCNCGLPDGLIVDGSEHHIRHRLPSTLLPLGILPEQDISAGMQNLAVEEGDRVLLASDGLTEAQGFDGELFGQKRFERSIADSAGEARILDRVNAVLDRFCGDTVQVDDISLVELPCTRELFPSSPHLADTPEPPSQPPAPAVFAGAGDGELQWQVCLALSGARLRRVDPVPLLINQIQELEGAEPRRDTLFTVLTELYVNAMDHGVLGLHSSLKSDAEGFDHYFSERERRLRRLEHGRISFDLQCRSLGGDRHLHIRVQDNGAGFNVASAIGKVSQQDPRRLHGRGISLLQRLCAGLQHNAAGNGVEVLFRLSG